MINSDQSTHNPLTPYMRHPEVYILLPSKGQFNSPDDIQFTPNGELAVSAMTTSDDLLLKTPEGLLNGDSMAKVIQSCCPGIKNVYNIPVPDLDVILLAIRQASYGDDMDFEITCPKCEYAGTYALSISEALQNIKFLDSEYFVTLSNKVRVFLKPFTFSSSVKESMKKYQEAQAMKSLLEDDLSVDDERVTEFTERLHSLAALMTELCSEVVIKIIDPEGQEIDASKEQINEWIKFLPRKDAETIQKKLSTINSTGVPKTKMVVCKECKHEWEVETSFDPSVFFVESS